MTTDDERGWLPEGIDPMPGVPMVRVLGEEGVMTDYIPYSIVKDMEEPPRA